jgi:hypothetical protein
MERSRCRLSAWLTREQGRRDELAGRMQEKSARWPLGEVGPAVVVRKSVGEGPWASDDELSMPPAQSSSDMGSYRRAGSDHYLAGK